MPSKFGRVFRAGIVNNFNDPTTVSLSVLSIDSNGKLAIATDTHIFSLTQKKIAKFTCTALSHTVNKLIQLMDTDNWISDTYPKCIPLHLEWL